VCIELGGIAKGFAVDRALQNPAGARADARPGERGRRSGRVRRAVVSIRDPRHPAAVLCQVVARNEALASSGGGEAAIIDPRRAAAAIPGATVRAPACVLADALTKMVIVLGEDAGPVLARYGASALFMSARGEVHVTRDWSAGVRRAS
jgi:thiamine biosynthesis lipoprotein